MESEPAGADARTSTGQTCKTPCTLAVPVNAPLSVTFSLEGYLAQSEQIELIGQGDGTTRLHPNPVLVQLSQAPPPPKKKPARRARPATAPKPAAVRPAAAPAAAAPAAATPAPAAASPWPTSTPATR